MNENERMMQQQAENQLNYERERHRQNMESEWGRSKVEMVRLAKEVLLENSKSKPVDNRDVTAEDITKFADTLISYVKN
jgi:hypothetical protein